MTKTHPIQCRCGKFQAQLAHPERGTRTVCYCRDCQAFAHYLGLPEGMLDPMGGTDIVAMAPRYVSLTHGLEHLACMSLSSNGILRWFSSCCRTPIGNTPRDIRTSHIGLVHSCLETGGSSLDEAFGPVRMRVNRRSARGRPDSTPGTAFALVRYVCSLAWTRISGRYRDNPFFDVRSGMPRVGPRVLTPTQRDELMRAVAAGRPAD